MVDMVDYTINIWDHTKTMVEWLKKVYLDIIASSYKGSNFLNTS